MKKLYFFIFSALFTFSAVAQPAVEWHKSLGGSSLEAIYTLEQTIDKGYILAGYTNSNNGDVVGHTGTTSTADVWMVKTDSLGTVEWQKCFGVANAAERAYAVKQTADSGYVIGGTTNETGGVDLLIIKTDADGIQQWRKTYGSFTADEIRDIQQASDGGYIIAGYNSNAENEVTVNHGGDDCWVVKLDALGDIEWEKSFGGLSDEVANSAIQTSDGGYIVAGKTLSTNDDVTNNHGGEDMWVIKLSSLGIMEWQRCYGAAGFEEANGIRQTADGGYIVAGASASAAGGDVSANYGDYDYWVIKINSLGELQWDKNYGGNTREIAKGIELTADGGYVLGGYTNSINGDVTGNHSTSPGAMDDFWVVKINAGGELIWQKCLGGTNNELAYAIKHTADGGYIIGGSGRSADGDLTSNQGSIDWCLFKLGGYDFSAIEGKLFADLNNNTVQDIGEPAIAHRRITEAGTGRFAFSDEDGTYSLALLDSGNFTVAPDPINFYASVPASRSGHFSDIGQTDSLNDFALQSTGTYNDLCVSLAPLTAFRSAWPAVYLISYGNYGTTTLSGSIALAYDNNLTFVSSSITPEAITSDSIVWEFGNITPYQVEQLTATFQVVPALAPGTPINSQVRIYASATDANPGCNYDALTINSINSYDPNDITVSDDTLTTDQLSALPFLEYTIRFQNTGNDTAFNIEVVNPIDTTTLDLGTFEHISASHPVSIRWDDEQGMVFTFNNILLPDSNTNELLSHGVIKYRIKPKADLIAGDSITNSVGIYFDSNPPVYTNTAVTEIVLITSLEAQLQNETVLIYPNPASDVLNINSKTSDNTKKYDISIYDISGRKHKTITNRQLPVKTDISDLEQGIYIIEIKAGDEVVRTRIIRQ